MPASPAVNHRHCMYRDSSAPNNLKCTLRSYSPKVKIGSVSIKVSALKKQCVSLTTSIYWYNYFFLYLYKVHVNNPPPPTN